jgi:hypothetical protein
LRVTGTLASASPFFGLPFLALAQQGAVQPTAAVVTPSDNLVLENTPPIPTKIAEDFKAFVAEIQLYGTPQQIELTAHVVDSAIKNEPSSFEPILDSLRSELRKELDLGPISDQLRWAQIDIMPLNVNQPSGP